MARRRPWNVVATGRRIGKSSMSAYQMHLDDGVVGPADEDEILAGIFRCRTPVYYDYENAEIREFLFRLAFKRFKDLWLEVRYSNFNWFRYNIGLEDETIMECFMKAATYTALEIASLNTRARKDDGLTEKNVARDGFFIFEDEALATFESESAPVRCESPPASPHPPRFIRFGTRGRSLLDSQRQVF